VVDASFAASLEAGLATTVLLVHTAAVTVYGKTNHQCFCLGFVTPRWENKKREAEAQRLAMDFQEPCERSARPGPLRHVRLISCPGGFRGPRKAPEGAPRAPGRPPGPCPRIVIALSSQGSFTSARRVREQSESRFRSALESHEVSTKSSAGVVCPRQDETVGATAS
jgi:hypothetical protein